MNSYTREFDHQMDERVVKLWREGKFKEFCTMLPEYADYCYGEGNMHDTVMLLGVLGWDKYDGKVEFITELFASSGTGQVNAVFPLPARRKEPPCRILSLNVPTTSASRLIYPACSPKSRARHRHLPDRRHPQPRHLAGHLADGRRQAGLRLRAYDAENRQRAQPGEP
jgi:hypothetical protein